MNLVIVESPTKAKTLSKILGKDYEIKASMGHIRDLPKSGLAIDVENNFEPSYEVPDKAKKTITELKRAAKEADTIILATDPDREGEAIAWHLAFLLSEKTAKKNLPKFERVTFHELTKDAIQEAFKHKTEVNQALVDAQQARRVLDRLVGYKLSPLLWKKVRFGLSAGRVQSVAVRLVVERERERLAFKAEEYWTIEAEFIATKDKKKKITATLAEVAGKKADIKTSEQAEKIKTAVLAGDFSVLDVKKSERKRNPNQPFKTSTLQQTAANVFGMSAKKTMMAAQKLFEQGLITYHRTDSLSLSPQFINQARDFITKSLGAKYLPESAILYKTNSKNAQEAHEAIRPTEITLMPNSSNIKKLDIDEQKIYSLIWKRSLESQSNPAVYDQTSISIGDKAGYIFKASGSVIKFDGWLGIGGLIGLDTDSESLNALDSFEPQEALNVNNVKPDQHFTQPPARYSDATLIKALEEMGIGRPSTYAPTLSTIQSRGYVAKEGKYYFPQDVSFVVNDLLVENFNNVVDYQFTADMEENLDAIANGEKQWVPVIREFYTPFEKVVAEKDKTLKKHDVTNLGESSEKCPECGRVLIFKLGKFGKFLSCSGYPECEYARPLEDLTGEKDENGNKIDFGKCPNCEDGVFILKQGRYGKFLACTNYPKCKTAQPYLEKIGMKCPKCADGEVVVKKAKRSIFYGCSRYPDCDYSSWKNPKPIDPNETKVAEEVIVAEKDID